MCLDRNWLTFGLFLSKLRVDKYDEGDGADVAAEVILRRLGLPDTGAEAASDESRPGMVVSPAGSGVPSSRIPCSVLPGLVGPWRHKTTRLPLSGAAAACLVSESVLSWDDLEVRSSVGARSWSGRECSLPAWVRMLSRLTDFISCAAGVLWLLLTCLVRLEIPATGFRGRNSRIPGHISKVCLRAHIEQADYDLEFLREQSGWCGKLAEASKSGHNSHIPMTRGIVSKWNAAAAAKHHTDFSIE